MSDLLPIMVDVRYSIDDFTDMVASLSQQDRALHNADSPTEMLTDLDREPLQARRTKFKLCMLYCIHQSC